MVIDYGTAFGSLDTSIAAALTDALPIIVPIFGALVGLTIFLRVLGKFGVRA